MDAPQYLEDVGGARVVVEDRVERARRTALAGHMIDLAQAMIALARQLSPDLPGQSPPSTPPPDWRGVGPGRNN